MSDHDEPAEAVSTPLATTSVPTDPPSVSEQPAEPADERLGLSVTHRRFLGFENTHLGHGLVDTGVVLGLVGDAAVELCIRSDGDHGLVVGYTEVDFLAPVHAGDVLEAQVTITRVGHSSRDISCEARVVCRSSSGTQRGRNRPAESSAHVLDEPLVVLRANGTVVVPHDQ